MKHCHSRTYLRCLYTTT